MEGLEEGAGAPLEDRLRQVEEAVREVSSGDWPMRRFESAVRVWLDSVEEQQRRLESLDVPESLRNEWALGMDGVRLFRQGLGRMLCYAQDRNAQHLTEGIDQVRSGNERLNQALRLNPMAREILGDLRP